MDHQVQKSTAVDVWEVWEVKRMTTGEEAMVRASINPVDLVVTMGMNKALCVFLERHTECMALW